MRRRRTGLILMLVSLAGAAFGHGLRIDRIEGGVGVVALYDDGSPLAFGEVSVFEPGAEASPVLTGSADRNGCFCFRPDADGEWRVTVDDGMGHAVTEHIQVQGQQALHEVAGAACPSRVLRMVAGLVLIAGIFGGLFWFKGRGAARRAG